MPFTRLVILALFFAACCGGGNLAGQQSAAGGGGPPGPSADGGSSTSPSSFVIWPVSNGTVTAYAVDSTGTRTTVLGSAATSASGGFFLQLVAPNTGPILLVVSSGSYTEPATGTAISLQGSELSALLSSAVHVVGDSLDGVLISPISYLTERLTLWAVNSSHVTVDTALTQSAALLESHFGGGDWRTFGVPPDLTAASSAGFPVSLAVSASRHDARRGFGACNGV